MYGREFLYLHGPPPSPLPNPYDSTDPSPLMTDPPTMLAPLGSPSPQVKVCPGGILLQSLMGVIDSPRTDPFL